MTIAERTIHGVAFRSLQTVAPFCDLHEWHRCALESDAAPQPIERWLSLLDHLATAHYPHLSRERALHEIGARAFAEQMAGPAGTLLRGMLAMGPERFLVRGASLSRHYVNFGDWTVTPLGPGHLHIAVEGTSIPGHYYAGFLERALEACGARVHEMGVENGQDRLAIETRYDLLDPP